uniref:hypothetical protein n=1 Tax=Streptomyces chartreusis TaxID=1969 RepID=UPI003F497322
MTRRPDHDHQAVEHWLHHHQRTLTDALDDVIDAEAGLREVLLQSRHDTATDGLNTVLDVEAGLDAILPTPLQSAPISQPATHETTQDDTATEELLQSLSPSARMVLRNHPAIAAASRDLARELARARDGDPFARARDLIRDLERHIVHDLEWSLPAADRAFARGGDLHRDVARAGDLARELERLHGRDPDRARVRALIEDLERHLEVLALAWARDRNRAALDRTVDRVRDLARVTDLVYVRAEDIAEDIIDIRTNQVRRAIGKVLRREPPALDRNLVRAFLNDFTAADLRTADLADVGLVGVRWSEQGTQWPPSVDVENLKSRSQETPPGSGIWVVRSGTAGPTTVRGRSGL